jgi:serine protease AprX
MKDGERYEHGDADGEWRGSADDSERSNNHPDTVKARLMKTAYKSFPSVSTTYDATTGKTYTDQYDVFTVGAGYVDIAAALANRDVATKSALSPAVLMNSLLQQISILLNPNSLWTATVSTWGTNAVWGQRGLGWQCRGGRQCGLG